MEDHLLEAPSENQKQLQDDDEGPPPGWEALPPPKERQGVDPVCADDDEDDGPPPGWSSVPPHPIPPAADVSSSMPPPPPPPIRNAVLGQMICGSCRKLLAYTHGARYVKCPCCKTVNYVLEEHQVGQVQCGTCAVLLMYPFGAPAVKCSSCRSVTEIGEHNKRPPWSVQQGHYPPPGAVP